VAITACTLGARRRCPSDSHEDGFTLVELLCAMFLFAVVLTIISSATLSMVHTLRKQQGQSDNLDASRKALELLDRQTRYANAITQPGANAAGTAQYIEFQTGNAPTAAIPAPPQTCYQWRLDSTTKSLQYRTWPAVASNAAATATAWNSQVIGAVAPAGTPVFETNAQPAPGAAAAQTPLASAPGVQSTHASVQVSFAVVHGHPSASTQNQVTLTAVDTTGLTTASAVCTPTSISGGTDRP
jgi:prepilin-type N-terminal cleavage/methylation domain-containing protein